MVEIWCLKESRGKGGGGGGGGGGGHSADSISGVSAFSRFNHAVGWGWEGSAVRVRSNQSVGCPLLADSTSGGCALLLYM